MGAGPGKSLSILFAMGHAHDWVAGGRVVHAWAVMAAPALLVFASTREQVYNILWALVFGFATLNILSLGARHFDARKKGLNFGEVLAILVVLVSVILLGWEMLYVFDILPIKLGPR
jgi:hypothetical protein